MSKRIVIALGGNALGNTAAQQLELVSLTAKPIVDLIAAGNEVIIAHGNGPQVGMINLGLSTAAEAGAIKSDMPFPECGAMSQGYIGYHLQNAIGNELTARGLRKDVATVVTQVLVDENDPAFQHPTKPIGSFYDKVAADRIMAQRGCTMVEDAGRGWRQVVPSPKPVDVIEKNTVRALVDSGTVVITVGGGGIPVVRRNGRLVGTPAVIDKDFASAKLAELLNADMLIILTAVEKVAINFGKPDQKGLDDLTPRHGPGVYRPGAVCPRLHAAQGGGCPVLRRIQARPHRPDHPAGEGQGRHRGQNRHPRPSVKSSLFARRAPRPAGKGPFRHKSTGRQPAGIHIAGNVFSAIRRDISLNHSAILVHLRNFLAFFAFLVEILPGILYNTTYPVNAGVTRCSGARHIAHFF